jgi:hypothetical protein
MFFIIKRSLTTSTQNVNKFTATLLRRCRRVRKTKNLCVYICVEKQRREQDKKNCLRNKLKEQQIYSELFNYDTSLRQKKSTLCCP